MKVGRARMGGVPPAQRRAAKTSYSSSKQRLAWSFSFAIEKNDRQRCGRSSPLEASVLRVAPAKFRESFQAQTAVCAPRFDPT
jgi:hypothetical protein